MSSTMVFLIFAVICIIGMLVEMFIELKEEPREQHGISGHCYKGIL